MVDHDWYAFCQALYKGIEGEDWRELSDAYKNEQDSRGVKKPQEAQKAKALGKMKAAKGAGEEYYDPTRKDNIRGRIETRLALWEEHLKDPIVALDKALKCVEKFVSEVSARVLGGRVSRNGIGFLQSLWKSRRIVCVYAQRPWSGTCQESTGRMASSSS